MLEPPTHEEIIIRIQDLKWGKAAGSVHCSKMMEVTLVQIITRFISRIWADKGIISSCSSAVYTDLQERL